MLPNYGAGAARLYHQDLTMVMCYNTRERTTNEAINIGYVAPLTLQIYISNQPSHIGNKQIYN